MRVGIVSPYSLTVPGGVQAQVLGLARAIRSLGHEAVALGPCDGPPPDVGVLPLGNSVPTPSNGSVAPIAPDPACALRTMRALSAQGFDVLHLHEPMVPGPTMTSLITAECGIVGTWHAAGAPTTSRFYRFPGMKYLSTRIHVRCAVSEAAKETAQEILGGDYDVLFNGIEVDRFAKAEPLDTAGPTILFLGRHEQRKGLAVLLDSLRHLPSGLRVWVAGEGPETERLRALHGDDDRIEWLGTIREADKLARLRAADVAVFPSLGSESFGIVLLEAMAAGTVVVASDLDGYRNVATDGIDALLAETGNAVALAACINRALTDARLADDLRAGGHQRAEELSMTALARLYIDRYEEASAIAAFADSASDSGGWWRSRVARSDWMRPIDLHRH